jgi:hypothetical protein
MGLYSASGLAVAALANGNAIASIVPAAAVGFALREVKLAIVTAGNTPTDFQAGIGINRATARGTSSGTATTNKFNPNAATSGITAVDNAWSVQPTLAATDAWTDGFNTRGQCDIIFGAGAGVEDFLSAVGTANPIVIVNRSGAALPANHQFAWTVIWEE